MKLAPSILSADFGILRQQVQDIEKAGADWLHIDVMDGHFVPNISFGAVVMKSIRPYSTLFFDVHLMIENPERYIEDFVKAGADSITVHVEAVEDVRACIELIRSFHVKVGLSIKPDTDIDEVEEYISDVDMILVMSVYPGFGGQAYLESVNEKIAELRRVAGEEIDIQVDGGINEENIASVVKLGANVIVAGSAVFRGNITESVKKLREAAVQ